MKTIHKVLYGDSKSVLKRLDKRTIDLMVTSPPYPMIQMWDAMFESLEPSTARLLEERDGDALHQAMTDALEEVWRSADAALKQGALACINIGDATRTLGWSFKLYSNYSKVANSMSSLGYQSMPEVLWRKQSNKPNKFMGSGMLPPGAYVTQEHEHIMVFRKGETRRKFQGRAELETRRRSAYFWEERNRWFSDIWDDLKGERQDMKRGGARSRSAAFPFELPYRLVSMFSVRGDLVLDPFLGTGTTTIAAMATCRNSVGVEMDQKLRELIESRIESIAKTANAYNAERLRRHAEFANGNNRMKYVNVPHGFPVMTAQETGLEIQMIASVRRVAKDTYQVQYADAPHVLRLKLPECRARGTISLTQT